jgi:Na+-transporting methylmalonyl-CoA/oxaloacetate decarboxylase gamma subunit
LTDPEVRVDQLERRLQRQIQRLQRLLPPAEIEGCKRVAVTISRRLPTLLASRDWETRLTGEIRAALASAAVPIVGPIIAAILLVLAAVIVLIGQIVAKNKEDEAAAKEKKQKLRYAMQRPLAEVERERDEAFVPRRGVTPRAP